MTLHRLAVALVALAAAAFCAFAVWLAASMTWFGFAMLGVLALSAAVGWALAYLQRETT